MLFLAASAFAGVLINEVYYDPDPEGDEGNEWIELCNNDAAPVDLSGWWVERGGQEFVSCFDIGTSSIAPGEYLLVGGTVGSLPGTFKDGLHNGGSETDGVRLVNAAGGVVDTVLYDSPNTFLLPDDLGLTTSSTANDVAGGHSIGRWNGTGDCADTDVSGDDFLDYPVPSPGAANAAPASGGGEDADCTGASGVRLNEFLPNPEGSDGGQEWVELFNGGGEAFAVSGWVVRGATQATGGTESEIPAGTILEPGAFLLLGSGGIGSVSLGNGTEGDGVYLQCNDLVVDSVVYGADNGDLLLDESGEVASLLGDVPGEGVSLARRVDGADTDDPSVDWTSSSENTPGAANKTPLCNPAGAEGLRVNEVLYDPSEDDSTNEFVELVNTGSVPVQLEGFVIEAAKSSWGINATLPVGAVVEPGAFFLIGGGTVSNEDYSATKLDLGQGGDGDGVRVLDCTGVVLDTVLYGDSEEDELVGDGGATDVVDEVSEGSSIGRFPDGEDTNAHTDWHPYGTPTPGAANADPGQKDSGTDPGPDTGGEEPRQIGCGPNSERPDGAACATTALPFGGLELVVAAVVAARRRRP